MEPLQTPPEEYVVVAIKGLWIYFATILCARIFGLRSFSKMSSFDFAMTVAIGSIIASTTILKDRNIVHGTVSLLVLFGLQYVVAIIRKRSKTVEENLDNRPMLLMQNGELLPQNMETAQVTNEDLYAKLREKNVLQLHHVKAVVMECTGDISVLHSPDPQATVHPNLLQNARNPQRKKAPDHSGQEPSFSNSAQS